MSSTASSGATVVSPAERVEVLFDELAELVGQRNGIDGRIVEIVAELDRDELCGATGARSIAAVVAWKMGSSTTNATTIATVAHRLAEFPRCAQGMREGRLSLDQVGVIAGSAGQGSDAHYAELAAVATVSQLRTALKLEPRPQPEPQPELEPAPEPRASITKTTDEASSCYRITLGHTDAAKFDAALQSHRDELIAERTHDHDNGDHDNGDRDDERDDPDHDGERDDPDHDGERAADQRPPLPSTGEAFMRLVESGWDAEAARRPHGQHTTVVMHLDVEQRIAALHLGPLLPEAERRYLMCDATCEVWFERDGQAHRRRPGDAADLPSAASCPGVSPPHVCGARVWGHPRSACSPHPALGRRRPYRVGQPGAGEGVARIHSPNCRSSCHLA